MKHILLKRQQESGPSQNERASIRPFVRGLSEGEEEDDEEEEGLAAEERKRKMCCMKRRGRESRRRRAELNARGGSQKGTGGGGGAGAAGAAEALQLRGRRSRCTALVSSTEV